MSNTAKKIALTSTPDRIGGSNKVEAILAIDSGQGFHHRFGVGFVPKGAEGRQVYQGPKVPGPWAYAFGLGATLCADPNMSTGAVRRRNLAAGIEYDIQEGDTVDIDGIEFVVSITARGSDRYINLNKVEG